MAVYEFTCRKCGTEFEVTCHMDEREAKAVCPKCGRRRAIQKLSAAFTSPDWRINLRGGHATIGTSDDPGVYGPRKLVTVTDRPDLAVLDGTDPLPVVEVGQELYALLILNSNGDVLSYVGDVAATGTGQAPSNATVASRGPGAFITLGVLRWIRTDDASFTQEQLYWRRDW